MRRHSWALLAFAAACYAGAAWIARDLPRHPLTERARELARPFVLPALWHSIDAATRRGDLVGAAALGRDLLRFLPRWADGHIHFAAELAFDYGLHAPSADEAMAGLDAGIAWLEDAKRQLAAAEPALAARLAAAQATFVRVRASQDPAIAAALRSRAGLDPDEIALRYIDQAIALEPGEAVALRERRAVLLVAVVAAALRTGDLDRAKATLDAAIELLRRVRDPTASRAWVDALQRFRPVLHGDSVDLERLRADVYLGDLVEAFESR